MKPKTLIMLIVLLLICMGFFSALLDYLIRVGWTVLETKNAFLVIIMITGEVVIALVLFTIVGGIVKKYFLERLITIAEIQTQDMDVTKSKFISHE